MIQLPNRTWKKWIRQLRKIPSNIVTKVSPSSRRGRIKTTASFYISHYDDHDGIDSDVDVDEGYQCSHPLDHDLSSDMNAIDSSSEKNRSNSSLQNYILHAGSTPLIRRNSSDIDKLRASALLVIDKQDITCKSAECLLNDYGDIKPIKQAKIHWSIDILNDSSTSYKVTEEIVQPTNKKGHSRSKSASLLKSTVVKECQTVFHKENSKSSVNAPEVNMIGKNDPGIKSHTLPRILDAINLQDNSYSSLHEQLPSLSTITAKIYKKKRDKIGSLFSTIGLEKKNVTRYEWSYRMCRAVFIQVTSGVIFMLTTSFFNCYVRGIAIRIRPTQKAISLWS